MLTGLTVGNFKAFADTQKVKIKPITLVFGANSAGKSSILHALLLAHHGNLSTKNSFDVHQMKISGDAVDLGGFSQYVHRRDIFRAVELGLEFELKDLKSLQFLNASNAKNIRINVQVGLQQKEEAGKPGKYQIVGVPAVQVCEMLINDEYIVRASRRPNDMFKVDRMNYSHPIFKNIMTAIIEMATTTDKLDENDFKIICDETTKLLPDIEMRGGLFPIMPRLELFKGSEKGLKEIQPISKENREEGLRKTIRLYLPHILMTLLGDFNIASRDDFMNMSYLGPLRSFPPRHMAFSSPEHDFNWTAGGGYYWDVIKRDEKVRDLVNAWLSNKDKLSTPYKFKIRNLITPDDASAYLENYFQSITTEEPLEGDLKKLGPDVEETTRYIYKDPDELSDLVANSLQEVKGVPEPVLIDTRSNTEVSHRDVGIGISQVLPVLVAAYASKGKIFAMEQPEIHLHPALQAELGDVFVESALGENKNTFLLETHSEHLVLRIMRRMRETFEGKLPKGALPVRPEDVSILYVEPDGSRSIVREMELNERGEFIEAWPGGFFEEGLREIIP